MKRRTFLQTTGVGLASVASIAGCLGSTDRAPPRESNVFREFDVTPDERQFPLVEDPWVETRPDYEPERRQKWPVVPVTRR
jgi:hypothetical protein